MGSYGDHLTTTTCKQQQTTVNSNKQHAKQHVTTIQTSFIFE